LSEVRPLVLEERPKTRYGVSDDKAEHMRLVIQILNERKKYWPLSVRGVHYPLLNFNFVRGYYSPQRFIRGSKPRRPDPDFGGPKRPLKYLNDKDSYKATADLLCRLRLNGRVPWEALDDPTRPLTAPSPFSDTREFIDQELRNLLEGYTRDLLQSQSKHIEVVCEKNTVYHMVLQVTQRYQLPTSSGRGFNSIDPWHDLHERFLASGKEKLAVIIASDYDPEGEMIPQSGGRTLRDEFGVGEDLEVYKAGVTREQIEGYGLEPMNFAKEESSNYDWFVKRNGGDNTVYELEALDPADMLRDLDHVIRRVLDMDLFRQEQAAEADDLEELEKAREKAIDALKDFSA
jgi:hypothetical protein